MLFAMGDDLSYGLNTLGPLCLWQCFAFHSLSNLLDKISQIFSQKLSLVCFRIEKFAKIQYLINVV